MARQLRRATVLAPFVFLAGFLALSCFDNTSGPRVFEGRFSLVPQFASSAAEIVTLDRFRVLLRRTSDGTVALDTTIAIVPGTDSVDLSLSVPMFTSSESFLLTLSLITPAGDTAFQAADTVTASTSGGAPPAIPVTVVYTGVGSHAKAVQIVTLNPSVFFGDTVTLVAEALDSNGVAIPLTPVAWASLDTLRAKVPNAGVGKVVGVSQRGLARITATLLNGPMDTVAVLVQPRPARMAVEAGNNQSAQVATALAQPVRFRVKAADSLGVANIVVKFGVVAGGGALTPDSAITDDSGRVNVQWKLGPTAGAQAIRARIQAAIPDSVVTAGATALAGPPDSLAINDGNLQTAVAGLAVATAPSVVVRDSLNNLVSGATVTFQVTGGGGSVTGATPVTDSLGVARVGSWTLGTLVGANALRAFVVRGPGDTLRVTFSATAIAGPISPATSSVSVSSSSVTSGSTATLTLRARDSSGNTVTTGGATVAFTASGGAGVSTGTIGATADSGNGVYTATFTGVLAGTATTIGATIGGTAVTTTLPTITVTPGPISAGTSVVTVSSPTVASAASVTLTLRAKDAAGNNLTTGGATVVFSYSGGTSTGTIGATTDSLNGMYTAPFTGIAAGAATTIGATINATSVATVLPTVTVTGGPPASLVFTTEPSNTTVNAAIASFQVTARDAAGNTATFSGPITLAFQNNPAGGSLGGTVTVNAVNGVATFSNVSVTTVGSRYALQATTSGATPATSQQFLITPVGMTHLWTGATDTAWAVGTNWQGSTAPSTITDNVFVPASAAKQPTISSPGLTVGAVVVETGAALTIAAGDTLSVSGNLLAGFTSVKGPGAVRLAGSGTLAGSVPSLLVMGSYIATDRVKVAGDVVVRGVGHNLTLGGKRVNVTGAFSTDTAATLTMVDAKDTLDVTGSVTFAGGNTTGLLTAGVILAQGDFTQRGIVHTTCTVPGPDTVETFKASGTHRVRLIGTGVQKVSLGTPGGTLGPSLPLDCLYQYAGGSQFANLDIDNAAGVTFAGTVLAAGNLTVVNGNIDATNQRLSVTGNMTTPANLTAATLEVGGTLTFGTGTYAVNTSTFLGPVGAVPAALPYQVLKLLGSGATIWPTALNPTSSLVVGGTVHLQLGGNSTASDVTVQGSGVLALGGFKLTVPSALALFQTTGSGALQMTNANDTLDVGGSVSFYGGSTAGLLTAGNLLVGVGFYESGSDPQAFAPSATHKTVLNGTAQTVSFLHPDSLASHFQNLDVMGATGTTTLYSDVYVAGIFRADAGDTVTGLYTLTVQDSIITNLTRFGAIITPAKVRVGGKMAIGGPTAAFRPDTTEFFRLADTIAVNSSIAYKNVRVTAPGPVRFAGPDSVGGWLAVSGKGALSIDTNTVIVGGDLLTQDNGVLRMLNSVGSLTVYGNAMFGGGSTKGQLKAGNLRLKGNFTQTGSATAFAADVGHLTSFLSTGVQQITFANPDTGTSHFGDLRIAQVGAAAPPPGVSLQSPIFALGGLRVPGDSGASQTITGNAKTLTVGGLNVAGLTLDHAPFVWDGTGPFSGSFKRVMNTTFTNYLDSEVQFYIRHPGTASQISMSSGLAFLSNANPANGGYYMKAEDTDGVAPYLSISTFFFTPGQLPKEPSGLPNCQGASTLAKFLTASLSGPVFPATILYACS